MVPGTGNHILPPGFRERREKRQNNKEKKERESITYAIYREKTSLYTQPGNSTWEQEATLGEGRRQAGPGQAQAQVR